MEQNINVQEVLSTFNIALDKLEKDFHPSLLSKTERAEVDKSLTDVIRLGLKVKLQYQQRKIESLIQSLEKNQAIDLTKIQLMSKELERVLKLTEMV